MVFPRAFLTALLLLTPHSVRSATVEQVLELDVIAPFTVSKSSDLEFGQLTAVGKGSVDLDPVTRIRTVSGGVTAAGGSYGAATFTTRGNPGGRVRVRVPDKKIDLAHENGNDALSLRRLRTDLRGNRHSLDADGYLTFHVGGTLDIRGGSATGRYEGSFEVEVTYE